MNKRKAANMPSDLTASENSNSPVSTPAKKPKMDAPLLPPSFAGVVNSNNREYVSHFLIHFSSEKTN